ncbi:MAG: peptidylprolyl isomerase [Clostridia bacterium]|nr:peptidylprolyl isomerase [Clostridia bacterium]
MNKFARLLALLLTVMLCVTSSVCAIAESETTEVTANPADVLVTVNGQGITREKIDMIASNLVSSYAQYGYDTSDAAFMAVMNQYAVEYAVQLEVMEQKAVEMGYDQFTEEEKAQIAEQNTAEWNQLVDMYVSYYGGVTAESTEEEKAAARVSMLSMLESMGLTEAAMLENTMENTVLDRVEASMVEGVTVTDEEVKALFDEYVKQDEANYKEDVGMYEYMTQYYGEPAYYTPEGYRGITHILLEVDQELLGNYQALTAELEEQQDAAENPEAATEGTEETTPVTQADVDAAYQAIIDSVQPTIDEINQKLADGVSFADLIVEYGTDPGMDQEPAKSEGYSVHMDSIIWDPVFVRAAFSVNNVGDIAAPVVGSYGVHIVQYTRDVPAGAVEYTEDIALALHEAALSEKENEQFNTTMEAWLAASVVSYSAEAQAMIDAGMAVE